VPATMKGMLGSTPQAPQRARSAPRWPRRETPARFAQRLSAPPPRDTRERGPGSHLVDMKHDVELTDVGEKPVEGLDYAVDELKDG
jgi:hypothetical protein